MKLLLRLLLAISITASGYPALFAQETAPAPGKFGPMADKYDQNKPEHIAIRKEVEKLFAKADKSRLTDLLPFSVNNKTGIINKITKEVIIAPTHQIKEIITIANPNLWGIYQTDTASYYFIIYQNDGRIIITKTGEASDVPKDEFFRVAIKDLADGTLGYTLNKRGAVIAQSKQYRSVQPAFDKDGEIYAAVQLKENNLFGIVDTKGAIFPGFEFKYRNLIHNKTANYYQNNIWFYAEDADLNKYFVGINGVKKSVPGLSQQPVWENDPFGYNIHHNAKDKTWGLLDQSTMEWTIAPQSSLELLGVHYTSKESRYSLDVASRKDCAIYIYVKDKNLNYYMDLNGMKYLPQEYLNSKPAKRK